MEPKGSLLHLQVPTHFMALNKYLGTLFHPYSSAVMMKSVFMVHYRAHTFLDMKYLHSGAATDDTEFHGG